MPNGFRDIARRVDVRHFCWLLMITISGCASTGYVTTERITVPKMVNVDSAIPAEIAPFAPKFVSILTASGLSAGKTDDPHALQLRFDFNGNPFNLRVAAAVWRDGVPILTASATNSGWGTALARGAAVQNLANSAASKFEQEMRQLRPRLQIIDSPTDAQ